MISTASQLFRGAAAAAVLSASVIGTIASRVAFASASFSIAPVHQAEGTVPTCFNLDVVFLIDQSDSMSGGMGAPPSDPTDQREFAAEAMVDLLSDIALDTCPDAHHRMAVVSWGSDVRVDLPLSDIAPDTFEDAQALRDRLKDPIRTDELGQTNPRLAFEEAADILDDAAPVGDGIRKRVIVFITDGHPCVTSLGCTPPNSTMDFVAYARAMREQINADLPFDPVLLGQEQCLNELRSPDGSLPEDQATAVTGCLDRFRADESVYLRSTYIYQILLGFGESYSQRLREVYDVIAAEHAGRVIALSGNRKDIPTTFNQILTQLAGVKATRLSCGNFAVNPYLTRIRLVLFKFDPEILVRFSYSDAAGVRHEISNGQPGATGGFDVAEYYQYGANERYEFIAPYPGIWQLESESCDGLDAFYDPIEVNPGGYQTGLPVIPQYDREPYYDPEEPVHLEYQMRDISGVTISQADWPQFAVNIDATVTGPDGEQSLTMAWDAAQSQFRSTEPLRVQSPGAYRIDLVGTTLEHVGPPAPVDDEYNSVFSSPRELFRHEGLEFTVSPVVPFTIVVDTPIGGERLAPIHDTLLSGWPLTVHPIPIRAHFVDREGHPLTDLERVLTDPAQALSAQIQAAELESPVIVLQPDPASPGAYVGEIPGFAAEGQQTLVVRLESGYTRDFRPDAQEVVTAFERIDNLLGRSATYYSLLALAIASVAAMIVYNIVIRTNPIRGTLVFRDGLVELATFGLANGRNWRYIKPRELRSYPTLMLRSIRAENRSPGRRGPRRGRTQDVVAGNSFEADFGSSSGVRLRCVAHDGRRFSLELDPKLPVTYSSDSIAQVVYEPIE